MLRRLLSSLCVLVCAAAIVNFARADTTGGTHNPTWLIERVADPIFDTLNVTAMLRETGVTGSLTGLQKALVLHCFERELDVVVVWGKSDVLGPSLSGDSSLEVIWRFDDASPHTERWSRTTGNNATVTPDSRRFLRLLQKHQRLAVRTYPTDDGSLTAVFDLTEAYPVVDEINTNCLDEARPGEEGSTSQGRARVGAETALRKRTEEAHRREMERAIQEQIALNAKLLQEERHSLVYADRIGYIARIKDKIERNWLRPPGTASGLKCVVRVSQLPGGDVVQVDIQTGSGNVAFDRSVEEAVLRSSPLPVPKDPSLFDRTIVITFEPEA